MRFYMTKSLDAIAGIAAAKGKLQWKGTVVTSSLCVREYVKGCATMYTRQDTGDHACRRCFNAQVICLQYDTATSSLFALPLPPETRAQVSRSSIDCFIYPLPKRSGSFAQDGIWEVK